MGGPSLSPSSRAELKTEVGVNEHLAALKWAEQENRTDLIAPMQAAAQAEDDQALEAASNQVVAAHRAATGQESDAALYAMLAQGEREYAAEREASRPKHVVRLAKPEKPKSVTKPAPEQQARMEADRIRRSKQADWDNAGRWLSEFRESGAKLEDQDADIQRQLRWAINVRSGQNPYRS